MTGQGQAAHERAERIAELNAAIAATVAAGGARGAGRSGQARRKLDHGDAQHPPGDPKTEARAICLRLLTGADRSRADLAQALRRRGIPDDAAASVLDRLTEVGLVDDASYAAAFVASKHRDRGLGRAALRAELKRKGIAADLADKAVSPIDATAERERAAALVLRRLDSALFAGLPAARRRLLGMLSRRGYLASVATSVVDEALRGYCEPVLGDASGGPTDDQWDAVSE